MGNTTIDHQGKIVQVVSYDVELPNGKVKRFEKAMRAPWVRVIFQDESWRILISKERRHELWEYDNRLPGGKVFDKLKEYNSFLESWKSIEERVIQAATLEWNEEVWYDIKDAKIVEKKVCWATMERDLWYVLATSFDKCIDWTNHGSWEVIDGYNRYTLDEVLELITQWEIKEARSAGVLAQYILSKANLSY